MAFVYGPQTWLQVPQFAGSTMVSVHVVPHVVSGAAQTVPQVPPAHAWPVGHALPHVPQLLPSLVGSVQAPPQKDWPVEHAHTLAWQDWPPLHVVPQVPQFALSPVVSVQLPPHSV